MKTDGRDEVSWVAVELTPLGELKVDDGSLATLLRMDLGAPSDHQVFIPSTSYTRLNRTVTLHLMEGYAFVASGLEESTYFALEQKPYVNRVMSSRGAYGMRALQVVPNSSIENLRKKLHSMLAAEVFRGLVVRVVGGTYSNLEGEVLDVEEEYVTIRIVLRSMKIITRVPKVLIEFTLPESAPGEGGAEK